jgi:hypothetical protein
MRVVAVVLDQASFGGGHTATAAVDSLWSSGIPAFRIKNGDDLVSALAFGSWQAQRYSMGSEPAAI